MSVQRSRGEALTVYRSTDSADRRGDKIRVPDLNNPFSTFGHATPNRASRAEVPGQLVTNIYTIRIGWEFADLDMWGRVHWRNKWWDIIAPPEIHTGPRQTRHVSIDVKERPGHG